jgi:hypothetical protein
MWDAITLFIKFVISVASVSIQSRTDKMFFEPSALKIQQNLDFQGLDFFSALVQRPASYTQQRGYM